MTKVAPDNKGFDLTMFKLSDKNKGWIGRMTEQFQFLDQLSSIYEDTEQSPESIFSSAEQFLSALVSLGVVAGLLAGTSLATVSLSVTQPVIGGWITCMSLVSCSVSIAVAMIVSFVYYTGFKLLSRGNLMIKYFIEESSWIRFVAVRGFILASCLQVGALILISFDRVLDGKELVPSIIGISLMLLTCIFSLYLIYYMTQLNRKCKKVAKRVRESHEVVQSAEKVSIHETIEAHSRK